MEENKEVAPVVAEEKPKKENKRKSGKSFILRLFDILLWVLLLGWMAICITDFIQVQREAKTVFCRKFEVTEYPDGTVESCTGLGYKVFYYKRTSYKAFEFGPFWSKDRSADNNK